MRDPFLYLRDIVRILSEIDPEIRFIEAPVINVRDDYLGGLTFAARYRDASELHVELWADCSQDEILWRWYTLHYQDRIHRLRFRYDNAPHHSELSDFPRHAHISGEIRPGGPPAVSEVARRIERYLSVEQ